MLLIPFVENAFKHSNIETMLAAIDLIANATGIHLIVENSFKKKVQRWWRYRNSQCSKALEFIKKTPSIC
jgi:sensor histidine kinase YesM